MRNEKRIVLKLTKALAPIKVAVLPLLRNRPEIAPGAATLATAAPAHGTRMYDDTGAIGRLYRRQDEIGTLFCVTVDWTRWKTTRSPSATATP